MTNTITLKDKHSGNLVWITLRDGIVVGAAGSDPNRYLGKTEQRARHMARYGR